MGILRKLLAFLDNDQMMGHRTESGYQINRNYRNRLLNTTIPACKLGRVEPLTDGRLAVVPVLNFNEPAPANYYWENSELGRVLVAQKSLGQMEITYGGLVVILPAVEGGPAPENFQWVRTDQYGWVLTPEM